MQLKGRKALVTGAGRGIGRAIALALAAAGAQVALLARTRGQLEEVAAEIGGARSLVLSADLAREAELRRAFGELAAVWGGVDILVNNAGVLGPIGPAHQVDPTAWLEAVRINLGGCFLCSQLVLPGMIAKGYGKIINLSGGGAVSPRPCFSAYSAAKAGVVRFTETLAAEVAPYHIDVNAVAPGAVNTRMLDQVLEAGRLAGDQALAEARRQQEEGGTDPIRPAALVVYLASPRSDGLSGRLFSAVWDDWQGLDVKQVMQTEHYTVRRIVPPK
ncbi:MAG: SDR family oxidoreductase [Candidatus Latescibacteria bacterium]|nr:SDR family oxidoreductase [Candidatus Latescibacterota bacterium]